MAKNNSLDVFPSKLFPLNPFTGLLVQWCNCLPYSKAAAVDVKRALRAGANRICTKKQRVDVRKADNAERDCHRRFNRMGFSLPIAIRGVNHETETGTITTHWVRMTDYCEYFLRKAPFLLVGGNGDEVRPRLQKFWEAFRNHHPTHQVYQAHANELDRCIPYMFHGDEGKGPKRATFMDFSFETPFGLDLRTHRDNVCSCFKEVERCGGPKLFKPDSTEYIEDAVTMSMSHNAKGHSYLKRYLVFGLPHAWYKDGQSHILDKHIQLVAENAQDFFERGVCGANGEVFYGAFIGLKGDLKFHKDITVGLTRSYANMGRTRHLMMCSYCFAGLEAYPFEEIDEEPQWSQTLFAARPWGHPPVLSSIAFDSQHPEFSLKLDPFHILKVGFNRDVVGSIIVTLARLEYYDFSDGESMGIPARLKRAHGLFRLWCAASHKSAGLRSFTTSFFNIKGKSSSPWTNSKGSDSTLLLKWLRFFLAITLQTVPRAQQDHKDMFKVMIQLVGSILDLQETCQGHGLFMPKPCGERLHQLIMTICRSYHWLARENILLKIAGFSVKPKYHALKHIAFQLRKELQTSQLRFVINPLAFNCEGNEDHVGRVCKLGRSVATRTISRRVLQRYFLKTSALIKRHRDKCTQKR